MNTVVRKRSNAAISLAAIAGILLPVAARAQTPRQFDLNTYINLRNQTAQSLAPPLDQPGPDAELEKALVCNARAKKKNPNGAGCAVQVNAIVAKVTAAAKNFSDYCTAAQTESKGKPGNDTLSAIAENCAPYSKMFQSSVYSFQSLAAAGFNAGADYLARRPDFTGVTPPPPGPQ